jgi:murein DD-endopeptidase MepM/ murein hydrolase activator NlpD
MQGHFTLKICASVFNTVFFALHKTFVLQTLFPVSVLHFHPPKGCATFLNVRFLNPLQKLCALALVSVLALAQAQSITVRSGDTLSSLSKRHGVSLSQLRSLNDLNSDRLRIGQTLRVSGSSSTTASSSSVTRASSGYERPLWPMMGVITQRFSYRGPKRGHAGLDLAAPTGTPIYAALSGTVTFSGWNVFGYGQLVTVRGIDGRDYYYAHNSRRLVSKGQRVRQGQMISRVGSTGNSTGPHLHFEIRSGSAIVNPSALLPSSRLRQASSR